MSTDTQTLEDLKRRARELDIAGRSKMTPEELAAAITTAEERGPEAAEDPDAPEPGTPAQTGRPEAIDVAEERAAKRDNLRAIGAPEEA